MEAENKVPFLSLLLPVYNEEAIIIKSLNIITNYLNSSACNYVCEVIIIDDGSTDNSGKIADSVAKENKRIRVIHHPVNMNLGRALQTGFRNARGRIIVVLDLDLSYSVEHIKLLVDKQISTDADIVIASPYMKGGKVTGVPFKRALLSRVVNRFMRFTSQTSYHTYTGMVRAYKTEFIQNLNLKTINYEINPEILYKAVILRARIVEIPAHLDWTFQNMAGKKRTSGMMLKQSVYSGLMAGFIFRPYIFFLSAGSFFLAVAAYIIAWIFINTFQVISTIQVDPVFFDDRFSQAIGQVFKNRPHAFFVGGITLVLAIQILSLGFLSLQKKRYFEEQFHISTSILKQNNERKKDK